MRDRKILLPASVALTLGIYAFLGYLLLFTEKPEALSAPQALLVNTLPHAIALVNSVALAALLLGWASIKRYDVKRHRVFMLVAVVLIVSFLVMYVTRISLGGVKKFLGPELIYLYVYLPMLTIHVTLSIVSVPLVIYNALSGLLLSPEEIPKTKHPRVGRVAVYAWSVSLALGVAVYFLLNYSFLFSH